jgi:peptidyl-prolyl cis-trans isomerase C
MIHPFLAMAAARQREISNSELNMILKQAVQTQVDQQLLKEQCEKDGFKPDPVKASVEVDRIQEQVGKEKFDFVLEQQGLKRQELVDRMSVDLMIGNWVDEKVRPAIKVDDAKIQQFYSEDPAKFNRPERVRASHILFKVEPTATAEQKKKAKAQAIKTLAELRNGADFAQLARDRSDCPSNAKGGDLGFFPKGRMAPEFEEAAFRLKAGELSEVVETQFGYHIIKTDTHLAEGVAPLAEVRDELRTSLSQRELGATMEKILADMRRNAKVEILIPALPEDAPKPAGGDGLPTILPQNDAGTAPAAAPRPARTVPERKPARAAQPDR